VRPFRTVRSRGPGDADSSDSARVLSSFLWNKTKRSRGQRQSIWTRYANHPHQLCSENGRLPVRHYCDVALDLVGTAEGISLNKSNDFTVPLCPFTKNKKSYFHFGRKKPPCTKYLGSNCDSNCMHTRGRTEKSGGASSPFSFLGVTVLPLSTA